jgi:hypothetical protein
VTFSLCWAPKTHFRAGRHENKEKRLIYCDLIIFLPIQIQFLEIGNLKKNPKIDSPYCSGSVTVGGLVQLEGQNFSGAVKLLQCFLFSWKNFIFL